MNAYLTLLSGEAYVPGALALARLLKQWLLVPIVVLLDSLKINHASMQLVRAAFDDVVQINDSKLSAPLEDVAAKLGRAELAIGYLKLLLWNMDYDTIVYLDADTLPVRPIDDLFEFATEGKVAAAPDAGWPDIFNSGVMVLKPDKKVYGDLLAYSKEHTSFDGADQGLLNDFFAQSWTRIPFVYNVTPNTHYQYSPAYERFKDDVRVVHFIGAQKPWQNRGEKSHFETMWWDRFNSFYTHDADRIHLLSAPAGEAANLSFEKIVNQWDQPHDLHAPLAALSVSPPAKLFPWEHRDRVSPTRVFHAVNFRLVPKTAKVKPETVPPPTTKRHTLFGGDVPFDPDRLLEEVSQMPFKFMSKKRGGS